MAFILNDAQFQSATGITAEGQVASCSCQPGIPGLFIAFRLQDQDHFHLQCAACGVSYCHQGACEDGGGKDGT